MLKTIKPFLWLCATLMAAQARAAPASDEDMGKTVKIPLKIATLGARSTVEHFTLGSSVNGALPIYSIQKTLTYDDIQEEVVVNIDFPIESVDSDQLDDSGAIVTQVDVYLEGSDGFQSQAFITDGGIGDQNISLQIVASETLALRYMVIVYGQRA